MHKCMRIELEGRTKKLRGKIKFSRGVVRGKRPPPLLERVPCGRISSPLTVL